MTGCYIKRNTGPNWIIKQGIFSREMSTLNISTHSHDKKEFASLLFSDMVEIITR